MPVLKSGIYDSVFPFLGIYLKEIKHTHTNSSACIFIAVLFVVPYSPKDKVINTADIIHTIEYYSGIKRNKLVTYAKYC